MIPHLRATHKKKLNPLGFIKGSPRKGRFYRKSLITILLIASIPGLITGMTMYWLVIGQMEKEFNRLHQNQIMNRAENLADQFSYMELSLSHWAFEPRFGEELKEMDYVYQFTETVDIMKTLYVLQGSNPLIQKVELYVNEPQPILFNRSYSELTDLSLIESYNEYLKDGSHIYWTDRIPGQPLAEQRTKGTENNPDHLLQTDSGEGLVLVHKIPGGSLRPFGALIVKLDNKKVTNLLKTLTPYDQGSTFLMDQKGNILLSGGDHEGSSSKQLNEEIRQKVDLSQDKGSLLYTFEGISYSVSYGKMNRIDSDWIYVSAAPITDITAPLLSVSKGIVLMSTAGLLLAILLSWLVSRRIYTPIERLLRLLSAESTGNNPVPPAVNVDEFELLEAQWNELVMERSTVRKRLELQLPQLRDGYIMQLIQGHLSAHSETDLRQRLEDLGFRVQDQRFLLVRLQLTGYSKLSGRFLEQDKGLVTLTVVNIIEEFAEQRFEQVSVLNFHDLSAAILLTGEEEKLKASVLEWSEELMVVINQIMKMNVTIMVGRSTSSIRDLPSLFMELEQAEAFHSIEELNQLLDLDHLTLAHDIEQSSYPFLIERDLIHAIRTGKEEEAGNLLHDFVKQVTQRQCTIYQLQQMMLQLLASMLHMMLQSGIPPYELFSGRNLYDELAQLREPLQIEAWLKSEVIAPFIAFMEDRSHSGLKPAVERTMERIDQQYMTDISLEACADLEDMTPYALSKAFKQVAGINFIDYVTFRRMDMAKRLLRETDLKINEIADQVGYQHSYFNRIFKKQEGLTPGQYREQWNR
ncbi:AraC family transcriptional regulator [Paenibacillus gallinarum]|uniref:AraC family transcriptional regulator n=1 Tax=Paenibacillus gallinarum TaxID=2762232 RepID=A0ABR8T1Y6_9BACL|nr:AraC family transcriptional regulator [Paenibacillus gallinarum]MBD7969772.1 AraC family transcriptional regulator [Paenibacillus gallinarum]